MNSRRIFKVLLFILVCWGIYDSWPKCDVIDELLYPRQIGQNGHKKAMNFITKTLKEAGFKVSLHTFTEKTPKKEVEFTNIIGTKTFGHKDSDSLPRLVLAAHYESLILPGFVGAVDSAAPCAILLEIAKQIMGISKTPCVLELIFFDGEEAFETWTSVDSLYGSRNLAKLYQQNLKIQTIQLFILLDLLGGEENIKIINTYCGGDGQFRKLMELEKTLKTNYFDSNCKELQFKPLEKYEIKNKYHAVQDDHVPFADLQVPCLHLIPHKFPKVWHTINDNKVDKQKIKNLAFVLKRFVEEFLEIKVY